jgi:hypothetical protein
MAGILLCCAFDRGAYVRFVRVEMVLGQVFPYVHAFATPVTPSSAAYSYATNTCLTVVLSADHMHGPTAAGCNVEQRLANPLSARIGLK